MQSPIYIMHLYLVGINLRKMLFHFDNEKFCLLLLLLFSKRSIYNAMTGL